MSLYGCVQLYLVQIPYDPMSVYMYKYVCVYIPVSIFVSVSSI